MAKIMSMCKENIAQVAEVEEFLKSPQIRENQIEADMRKEILNTQTIAYFVAYNVVKNTKIQENWPNNIHNALVEARNKVPESIINSAVYEIAIEKCIHFLTVAFSNFVEN